MRVLLLFITLIVYVVKIILIVAEWKIFSKADKPGWASLIPFYNLYVRSDIAFGDSIYFSAYILLGVIMCIIIASGNSILWILGILACFVLHIVYCFQISRAFEKSRKFFVGLVLLPFIFFSILGFGKDKYIGPFEL